ncbi:hypothetical protein B296_00055499 [Ensete ventricosum]|uniref:Uncharacterized protein n=1 Tax=Ensete ventricosum TaxID=4639 RepID=A0A426X1J1_ENSVE|nr:hypothetical protein B296_00055499 [Ensete ventricosum]
MGGALGSGSGGWLLAWWSSGREKVFQLGSVAESCEKVGSGGVPDVTSPTVKLVWLSILRSPCSVRCRGFYSNDCGRSYLRPLSSLLLTIPSYLTMLSVVLAMRHASSSLQLGDIDLAHLTLVRSVVQRLTLPCLCQADSNTSSRPCQRAYCPRARGRGSQVNIRHIILPPQKTFSRFLIRVPNMRSCNEPSDGSEVRLVSDPNEHELIRPSRGSGSDPTEQKLGN